jgi:3-oxoacyl-[acyl-carrier protein] reductase
MSLAGKVAIVTGASRGIGAAIADQLAEAGAFVIGTATGQSGVDHITERLGALGAGYVLDVSDDDAVDQFFAAIKGAHEAPLILVNNAGITRDNLALRMKEDEWDQVINTNLNSIYRVSKAAMRGMTKARWGRIINITSVVASIGNGGQSNYAAAKAGVEGYSRALASELGSRGITVNCVAPGFIKTDMTDALTEDQTRGLLAQVPAGRLGEPREVAALVAFLASENAGYITGSTLHINGGMYMN